jgi:hypothetical protein
VLNPVHAHTHRTNQPEQRICKIYPNSILHSLYTSITLGVLLDVHTTKDAEESDPEDEEYRIPDKGEWNARHEWDHVEDGCNGREGASDHCVYLERVSFYLAARGLESAYPFSVAVFVLFVCLVYICAIESNDTKGENSLQESENCVGNVAHCHLAASNDAHLP